MAVVGKYYWHKLYTCMKLSITGKIYQYLHIMDQRTLGFCYKTGHFDIFLVISIFLLFYDIGDNLGRINTP